MPKTMRISAVVAPINRRGLQRTVYKAISTLVQLEYDGKIRNLVQPNVGAVYIRNFDVPVEHLRCVERILQRNKIGYRKELGV